MKQHKWRILSLVLIVAVFFLVPVCHLVYTQKTSFQSFCKDFFIEEISSDTLSLHYTLAYPENMGIQQEETSLPLYEKKLALEDYQTLTEYCNMLESFNPENLSVDEQYTRSLLIRALSNEIKGQQYFYLQEVFSPSGGIQIQYPILMAEYAFRSKEDIENYLALIHLTPTYFNSYCKFTEEKTQKGFGMPDFSLKKVIAQCDSIITAKEIEDNSHFLITTFAERLKKTLAEGIITKEEAIRYLSTNKEYLSTYLLPAYTQLAKNLDSFMGHGTNTNGLCYYESGQDYYAWLFQKNTGSDAELSHVYKELAQDYYDSMLALRDDLIAFQNTSSLTEEDFAYFTLTDSDEMLKDLATQMEQDFPTLTTSFQTPSLQASVKDVSSSLENFTAPAYYLVPPIDDHSQNSIYINRSSAPAGLDLYTTLAHEGYPGHLYQTTYYQLYREQKNLPHLRSTLNYGGYVEGWALYVEFLSYDYAANLLVNDTGKEDYRLLFDIYKQERRASLALLSLLDVGIHYYGLTYDRVKEMLETHGIYDESTVAEIYEYIVEEPATYPKYYWSHLEILSLKDAFKEKIGTSYSDYAFHQFFLESGPSDFTSLAKRLTESESLYNIPQ